jgi:hypothetical protein
MSNFGSLPGKAGGLPNIVTGKEMIRNVSWDEYKKMYQNLMWQSYHRNKKKSGLKF